MKIHKVIGAVFSSVFKVVITVTVVLIVYKGAMWGYEFGYSIFRQEPASLGAGKTVTVEITEDMSALDIGDVFLEKGLVKDKLLFVAQYYLSEFQKDAHPGTFELSTAMTVEEMMEVMATPVEEEDGDSK